MKEKYWPKTTIPAPVPGIDPPGASSMAGLFCWPEVFMLLLSHHFGETYVKRRLRAWGWDLATAFSGVGCPENVPSQRILQTRVSILQGSYLSSSNNSCYRFCRHHISKHHSLVDQFLNNTCSRICIISPSIILRTFALG